ncbi:MAG: chromophore lyase CpcT/CpeT [Cyanobacteria bacterium P01_D01_bin.44]
MPNLISLTTLGNYLAGEFENKAQAVADPAWYVHLHVWQRPTRLFASDSLTLFLEQANMMAQQAPYRQRILRLQQTAEGLRGQYYALKQPLAFQGGGQTPAKLQTLTSDDLDYLPHCWVNIQPKPMADGQCRFKATPPANTLCSFEYQGQTKYVQLGFAVGPADTGAHIELLTYDKGIDPDTQRGLWGALMGPFRLIKQADYQQDWQSMGVP